jgi:hypothetical protein
VSAGWCIQCSGYTVSGVVLATVQRCSGPDVDVVIHAACEGPYRAAQRARLARAERESRSRQSAARGVA